MTTAPPTEVTLLRDLPQEGRMSMERFATELTGALKEQSEVRVKSFVAGGVDTGGTARRGPLDRMRRFGVYPLAVRRLEADAFHIIDQWYADLVLGLPAHRTVITCHDLLALEAADAGASYRTTRLTTVRLRATVRLLARAAHIVCDSEATRSSVLRLAKTVPARTSVVPPGVDRRFAPLPDARRAEVRAGITTASHMLFTVSNGESYKNAATTLRVLYRLGELARDAVLVRVGRSLSRTDRELARSLGVDGSVIEMGAVSDADLVDAYAAADVVLFPSLNEGFGWPVLEAMACGTPVVASNISVLRETSGDAALLTDPTDVRGLCEAVCSLLDHPHRAREQAERGVRRAASFSWRQTAVAYAEIYRAVAAEAAAGVWS